MNVFRQVDPDRLAELCRKYRIARLEVFGSRATGTARPDSDVDLLVSFQDGYVPSFLAPDGFVAMVQDLESLFGGRADVLTRRSVEEDPNQTFRESVLHDATLLYAA